MTRVGLKFLLVIVITSALQQAIAANPSDDNAGAMARNFSALITNVGQLRALSRADLNRGRPISLTGIVTLVDNDRGRLVLQDTTGAVMWYSDKPIDPALAGKTVCVACSNACIFATTFPDFPYKPSGTDIQPSFEAPSNWGDYHLTRMAALLRPRKSGEYKFWIASDDSSELWLSTDENPTQVRKIAFVTEGTWTDPLEWDRFPSQRSEAIYLSSDKSYYIEAFQEQGLQADHLAVAWEGPGIERSVISGTYLKPWNSDEHFAFRNGLTNGILREYWTNYSAGSVMPVTHAGRADGPLAGRDVTFQILGPATLPNPRNVDLGEPLLPENNLRWIQTEGVITFVSTDGTGATLELAAGARRAFVRVAEWDSDRLPAGKNCRVQVQGVCEAANETYGELTVGRIWTPSSEDVRLLGAAKDQEEPVVPLSSPTDSSKNFGGYYSARGAVMFDGMFSGRRYLYVQDINGSVCVSDADRIFKTPLEVGQRVQVGGAVSPSKVGFHLVPMTMRLLGWQALPLPEDIGDESTFRDGQWIETEGIVHSIRADGVLKMKRAGGFVSVWCPVLPINNSLVDCTVRLRGVVSLDTQDAPLLLVGSRQFVEIGERAPKDPFSLSLHRISDLDNLLVSNSVLHRIKVEGTITYVNESTVFLQDGSGSVRLQLDHASELHPGDAFEVVGFPDAAGSVRTLAEPNLRAIASGPAVKPTTWDLNDAFVSNKNGALIQVSANLLAQKNRGPVQVLELQSGQRVFEASLASNNGHLPPLTAGSLLKVVGVCIADFIPVASSKAADSENPSMLSLQILLRAPTDITIERGPPWWTAKKVVSLIGFLLVVLGGTLLWIRLQGRRFERRQLVQLEFSRQILKSQETERHRIAANLHDSLGQNLLVIKNKARLAMQPALDGRATMERLDEISGMASQVIEEVRQITHDLRPYQLERVGLTQTLRGTIRRVSENTSIAFASHVDDIDGLFANDGDIHVYRIVQEALNNVIKHSGATEATAVVKKEADAVLITVRDNGRGIANDVANGTDISRAGFGLSGIEERARILHGKALFDSSPGQGFRLTVEIPLRPQI
jgi:signal transduction histidine kinase